MRAQRLAAQERVYTARLREYELARESRQKRHTDELVDRYADALTGAADDLASVARAREDVESAHVAAFVDRHRHAWSRPSPLAVVGGVLLLLGAAGVLVRRRIARRDGV